MAFLLMVSRLIDGLNRLVGRTVYWAVLASVLVSAVNASVRKAFDISSNAWLELQWYLFSAVFLLAAGYTLLNNEHVRIDIVWNFFSRRMQVWIEIFGTVVFLFPLAVFTVYLSWPAFLDRFVHMEMSGNAGGLILWPVWILVPIGFTLLGLQGLSELIKRIAYLTGALPDPAVGIDDAAHHHGGGA